MLEKMSKRPTESEGGDVEGDDDASRKRPANITINREGEPVVTDHTGAIISAAKIARNNDTGNQVLNVLMQRKEFGDNPAAILSTLEKLNNKAWYQFIARAQLWRAAFSQKFPEQYKYAIEKPEWWERVKKKLDDISEKPGREFTYWKRWYELLTIVGRPFQNELGPYSYFGTDGFVFFNKEVAELKRKTPQSSYDPDAFLHVDKTLPICFVYFTSPNTQYMLSVNMEYHEIKIVSYDKSLLGEKLVEYAAGGHKRYHSLDGFSVYVISWHAYSPFRLRMRSKLVSCQQCQVNDAQYVEKNLRGLFCSERCQREFRLK